MPTKKPRVTFTLDETQLKKIDEYRFNYRLKNQTQAILSLIENGLELLSSDNSKKKAEFSKAEIDHIKKFRDLDDHGKDIVSTVLEKEHIRFKSEQEKNRLSHLMPVAAHNDNLDEEQQRLMKEDLDEL